MKETRYHIIKESDIDLELLPISKYVLKIGKGFEGDTHRELRDFGIPYNGYSKFKDGEEYWVLPYFYVPQLDVIRTDEYDNIIAKTYTLEEFNNFGFDIEENEV